MPKRPKDAVVIDGVVHSLDTMDPVEILVLADLHIGDPHSDTRLIQRMIDGVRDNPNRYCILGGDLMNNAIVGGKSDVYGETMKPSDQLKYAVKLLEPIKDKILCCVSGNHEERTTRSAGFDLTLAICAEMGISRVYQPDAGLVFVQLGKDTHGHKVCYSIYINHGRGGGRKPGGKINALYDMGNIVDADVIVCGHTHLPAVFKDQQFQLIPNKGQAVLRERLFVNTASALRYGGYGKRQGYQPASNSYPLIILDPHERRATATV